MSKEKTCSKENTFVGKENTFYNTWRTSMWEENVHEDAFGTASLTNQRRQRA